METDYLDGLIFDNILCYNLIGLVPVLTGFPQVAYAGIFSNAPHPSLLIIDAVLGMIEEY